MIALGRLPKEVLAGDNRMACPYIPSILRTREDYLLGLSDGQSFQCCVLQGCPCDLTVASSRTMPILARLSCCALLLCVPFVATLNNRLPTDDVRDTKLTIDQIDSIRNDVTPLVEPSQYTIDVISACYSSRSGRRIVSR